MAASSFFFSADVDTSSVGVTEDALAGPYLLFEERRARADKAVAVGERWRLPVLQDGRLPRESVFRCHSVMLATIAFQACSIDTRTSLRALKSYACSPLAVHDFRIVIHVCMCCDR
jgi:hypothetical protein